MSITEDAKPGTMVRRGIASNEHIPNAAVFLKRTALEFLQILFSQRAEGSFRYSPDDTLTEISITDIHAVDLRNASQRPHIVAVRGPLSWQGQGLGGGSLEQRNMRTGDRTFNDLMIGSVALSCLSREAVEAEQIAHIVFNSFKFFRPILQKYGFFTIKSQSIGSEALIEQEGSDDRTYIVPIQITAMIQDRWTLEDTAARRLERIIVDSMIK